MATTKKVLIVEDDADVAAAHAIRLGVEFETLCAHDGVSAIQAARRGTPDVILLDLGLPAGDGFKVLEWLRDDVELASIPVAVVTGRDGWEPRRRALSLGAKVFFHKPVETGELIATVRELADRPRAQRARLLVVEDDDDVRNGLIAKLRANHYEVVGAPDGATAMMAVRKHAPDLVVLDLGLPAGDGLNVLQRMRHLDEHASTPIVVLSGRDSATNRVRAIEAGASVYLEKPATGTDLLDTIEELL